MTMQIGAVALKEGMRGDRQEDVEIAGRPATHAGFALAGETDAGSVLDAGRNVHRQSPLAHHPARPRARAARVVDHLAAALAVRAGALEREEALGLAQLAVAAAHRTDFRLGAGSGAAAGAGLAGDRGRDADLRGLAGIGVLQADFHVVAQIRAALAPGAAAAPPAHAEQIVEDIGEGRGEIGAETVRCAHAAAMLEGGVAEAVIGRAFVGILEDLVGFVDFLEPVLGILVAGMTIRMALHRLLAEGGLDIAVAGGAFDGKRFRSSNAWPSFPTR